MDIESNLIRLRKSLPGHVCLIAVSKNQPPETIMRAYESGQRSFGENKAQEMVHKASLLPGDIHWHFIGHLQTNKVRDIAPYVYMIHSIDSLRLLSEVNRQAMKLNRLIPCLLQIHIATEESKFGLNPEEAVQLLSSSEFSMMKNIRIRGLMGMATFTDQEDLIRSEFTCLRECFCMIRDRFFTGDETFSELSMGMSGDYLLAIKEGSTMVRIGTSVFGER